MSPQEREMFYLQTAGLHELCKKYSEDIRGLLKSVIRSILVKFITVEKYFQSKTFEKNVKDIMLKVGDLEQTLEQGCKLAHFARCESNRIAQLEFAKLKIKSQFFMAVDSIRFDRGKMRSFASLFWT